VSAPRKHKSFQAADQSG